MNVKGWFAMIIDLSRIIENDMPVYPGDSPVTVRQNRFLEEHGFNNSILTFGPHAGTHLDGLQHMSEHPLRVGEFPLERFYGPAKLIDVRGLDEIGPEAVDWDQVGTTDILLFFTGYDVHFGSDRYFRDHPVMTPALGLELAARKIKLIGMDIPAPDKSPYAVHRQLFADGIFIVENLTGLEALIGLPDFRFYGFPLKLQADSSPIRAVAITG
jgi:kynurenine formamidase